MDPSRPATDIANSSADAAPADVPSNVPSAPTGRDNATPIDAVYTFMRPARLPARWRFLGKTTNMFTLGSDSVEVIKALRAKFSDEEMLHARVAEQASDGQLRLTPSLGSGKKVYFFRDTKTGKLGFADDSGTVIGAAPPAFTLGMQRTKEYPPTPKLIVASNSDMPILAALGVSVTTSAGLGTLTGPKLRQLFNSTPEQKPALRITFVGFDLANLTREVPPSVVLILERMDRAIRLFKYEPYQTIVDLWRPTAAEFDQIVSAAVLEDKFVLSNVVWASIRTSTLPAAEGWANLQDEGEVTLPTAHDRVEHVLVEATHRSQTSDAQTAGRRYKRALDQITREKFLEAAQAASDPVEALIMYELGNLSSDLVATDPLVVRVSRVANGNRPDDSAEFPDEVFAFRKQLINQFLKLEQHLRSRRR